MLERNFGHAKLCRKEATGCNKIKPASGRLLGSFRDMWSSNQVENECACIFNCILHSFSDAMTSFIEMVGSCDSLF